MLHLSQFFRVNGVYIYKKKTFFVHVAMQVCEVDMLGFSHTVHFRDASKVTVTDISSFRHNHKGV